jgi:uncharacterized membrane protein
MPVLILGLLLFLGAHSLRFFGSRWRDQQIARVGERPWKGLFSLVSIIGFVLIVLGFGVARRHPVLLYVSPLWLRHLDALFTLAAFVLVAAAYVPRNRIKARLGHPMLAGTTLWAFGHLLATGMLHDLVLFGSFLLWAATDLVVSRRRDQALGTVYPPGALQGDVMTLLTGSAVWAVFAFLLHGWLIGVNPMA